MSEPTYTFEGLRGVGRVELSFVPDQRVYALFGTNGVGKTKCLEALFQYRLFANLKFFKSMRKNLSGNLCVAARYIGNGQNRLSGYRLGLDPKQGSVEWSDLDAETQGLIASELSKGRVDWEHATSAVFHEQPAIFLGASGRGHVSKPNRKAASQKNLGRFVQRQAAYHSHVVDAMEEDFSSLGMVSDLHQWFVTIARSANKFEKEDDNREVEIDAVLQSLHAIDPRFDPKFLRIAGDDSVFLKLGNELVELRHLSSGFASLLRLVQGIVSGFANFTNEKNLTRVRGAVFIDEIESHLHSEWQCKIVLLLKELFPNTTFFIATHSPIVLSQLQEGEAYLLQRAEDGVVRSNVISAPNRRVLADVLVDAMGVNLNALKKARLEKSDQSALKQELLALLNETGSTK